jgi:hypothetical protein
MLVELLHAVTEAPPAVPAGFLLPAETLQSGWFQALAIFVAANTVVYAVISLAKLIPRRRE